jgi:hypothetical protein
LLLEEISWFFCLRATGFISSIEPQRAICHGSLYKARATDVHQWQEMENARKR